MNGDLQSLRAIVRHPSPRIAEGEVTHIGRHPMNVDLAFAQYRNYLHLLESHGVELITAALAPEHPDGVFVEDALFFVGDLAVLTRPGALPRRGEVSSIAELLEQLNIEAVSVPEPHTIDGGDVLCVGKHVFIGVSSRTTRSAIEFVGARINSAGYTAVPVKVNGCLHLKTAITRLPDDSLIAVPGFVEPSLFTNYGYRVHPAAEESGGDVLCLEKTVVLPTDAPRTAERISSLGFQVHTIDVSELQKIEAGVTCMSVFLP